MKHVATVPDVQVARVDAIGSLLRPPELVQAFVSEAAGEIGEDALRASQDDAVRAVIADQEKHGLPIITDGEFRRRHFMESFADVAGFADGRRAPISLPVFTEAVLAEAGGSELRPGNGSIVRSPVAERLRLVRNRPLEEFTFAQRCTNRAVKASLITPSRVVAVYDAANSREVYDDTAAFAEDVVRIQRQIIAELVDAGCRYLHIDAPGYAAYADERKLGAMRSRGEDPDENLARAIQMDNAVMAGFDDVTFGLHVCRGNFRGRLLAYEGSYDVIAERLYSGLDHKRLLLEYDDERAGGFESLRFVPKDKVVVLGLISTKSRRVETVDELERRVAAAAQFLSLDQLAISPQCGFGSVLDGNPLDEDLQWRKLDVMMEAASRIWGD